MTSGTELLEEDHTTGRRVFKFERSIFANVVLADEINRAAEDAGRVAAGNAGARGDGGRDTHRLPEPFFVLATQNPMSKGTIPARRSSIDS